MPETPKTGRPPPHGRAEVTSLGPLTISRAGRAASSRHATAPPSGSSTSPSRRGTAPGPQRDCNSAISRSTSVQRRGANSRSMSEPGRTYSWPDQCCQASEPNTWTGTPSASAASNTEASSGHHDCRSRREHGGKGRRTGVGHGGGGRHMDADPPLVRQGEAEPQIVSGVRRLAGGRPPAEGRAAAIPRPRRGPPGSAACAATVPNPRPARSSRAGTRHVGPADQAASRRTRSATARASVRPWRSSPAARRRSPETGAARALARQAARSPSHSASMAPMRR